MNNLNFTDKTQESLQAAIQVAKDYANAQGKRPAIRTYELYELESPY